MANCCHQVTANNRIYRHACSTSISFHAKELTVPSSLISALNTYMIIKPDSRGMEAKTCRSKKEKEWVCCTTYSVHVLCTHMLYINRGYEACTYTSCAIRPLESYIVFVYVYKWMNWVGVKWNISRKSQPMVRISHVYMYIYVVVGR